MKDFELRRLQLYALVRVDLELFQASPDSVRAPDYNNRIKVVKIVFSMDDAENEVSRLNTLNHDKGFVYFWSVTHCSTT